MAKVTYNNIEDGTLAKANDVNSRFGDVLAQVNGNLDAENFKKGGITRESLSGDAISASWPVGSVYISVNQDNPGPLLGGTWIAFGSGRTLVGFSTTDEEFNAVEKTGGAKTHKLTVQELPKHRHPMDYRGTSVAGYGLVDGSANRSSGRGYTDYEGSDQPHNNIQPYITVYFWKRIS